jgi:D-proline reductase (dithiol) PrdB
MDKGKKTVDGFRFLPPKLSAWIKSFIPDRDFSGEIPFHPLSKPLNEARLALITTAGISLKSDPPFDMEREKAEPTWGDRSYRAIPKGTTATDIEINHLHINCDYVKKDLNVMLPLDRMEEFAGEGIIGDLAPTSYSFYGFQWENNEFLDTAIRPMIDQMKTESTDAVLLTPA